MLIDFVRIYSVLSQLYVIVIKALYYNFITVLIAMLTKIIVIIVVPKIVGNNLYFHALLKLLNTFISNYLRYLKRT